MCVCSVASIVCLFLFLHWTFLLSTTLYRLWGPATQRQYPSRRRQVGVACAGMAGLLQHSCRLKAEAEKRQLLWSGVDTSAFRSDLITSSSVASRFCSISFSKQTPEQASRVVNPNDFCSHLKADALKCELSQLLSQRVSLDVEFGCVYYSRLLAVKTINLYLCNTCQTLQSPRAVLVQCCPFHLEYPPMSPVLKAWCSGTWWNLCGVGGSDRSWGTGNMRIFGSQQLPSLLVGCHEVSIFL